MIRKSFGDACVTGAYMINRDQLADAMTAANIMPQDVEILERMFTMFDKMGAAAIDYREFLAGLAPLVRGDVKARVLFGCEMFDVNDAGSIKKHELALIVNAMNNVASWFGDPAVRSRRPTVLRRLHAIDATRAHQTRSWVVSFLILRPFGPSRATAMLHTGHAGRSGCVVRERLPRVEGWRCGQLRRGGPPDRGRSRI